MRSASAQLTWHYQHPFAQAIEKANAGIPIAGMTSNTVPWELLRAGGFFPLMLNPPRGPAPFADRFMEEGVFSARIRAIFDGLVSGAWPFLKLVVIPRTSEQEHKLFLYLREIARQKLANGLPELYLYNLLHTRSPEAERFGKERTRKLSNYLDAHDLASAIDESNHAYRVVRNLLALREGLEPRLSGTEALSLIGAMYFMDRREYARLAEEAASEILRRPPIRGPRILIKGSPLHHTDLHQAVESQGAVVVAEDDWWGSRALSKEIREDTLFETYYRDAPGPRDASNEWFLAAAAQVDAVLFYLPQEDDVLGWDYPALRDALNVPSLLVRDVQQAASLRAIIDRHPQEVH